MLRVWSDVVTAADQRRVALLALLDMSDAFDCVDHDLLLQRLQVTFGVTGTSLALVVAGPRTSAATSGDQGQYSAIFCDQRRAVST